MGEPVTTGLMVASIAGSAASTIGKAGAAQSGGAAQQDALNARGRALQFDAAQQKIQQDEIATEAAQQEAQRQAKLEQMTGANIADLTSRGISSDSPSTDAIALANREAATTDIANIKYMGASRIAKSKMTADQDIYAANQFYSAGRNARQAGENAATSAWIQGGVSLATNMPRLGSFSWGGGGDTSFGGKGGLGTVNGNTFG
jgi:hypothetical protein